MDCQSVRLKKPKCQRKLEWRAEKGWWLLPPDIPEGPWQTDLHIPVKLNMVLTERRRPESIQAHEQSRDTEEHQVLHVEEEHLGQRQASWKTEGPVRHRQEVGPSPGKDARSRKHNTCSRVSHHSSSSVQCTRFTVSHNGLGGEIFGLINTKICFIIVAVNRTP